MQSVVPALLPLGGGVGDALAGRFPPHLIAPPLHFPDKLGSGFGLPHTQINGDHEPELPTLAPHR